LPRVHHKIIFSENIHISNLSQWIAGSGNIYINCPTGTAEKEYFWGSLLLESMVANYPGHQDA